MFARLCHGKTEYELQIRKDKHAQIVPCQLVEFGYATVGVLIVTHCSRDVIDTVIFRDVNFTDFNVNLGESKILVLEQGMT